jgi:hypothetical protein
MHLGVESSPASTAAPDVPADLRVSIVRKMRAESDRAGKPTAEPARVLAPGELGAKCTLPCFLPHLRHDPGR